jgi:hypothetical protein
MAEAMVAITLADHALRQAAIVADSWKARP